MSEIPSSDWSWIDAAARRFEEAWKRGPRPRIEDFLLEVPEVRWAPLLQELMRVEGELRRREGEMPGAEEFRRRFPDLDEVIASVFREARVSGDGPGPDLRANSCRAASSSASLPESALPDELANHPDYKIVRKLGSGGMGVVYLAHNRIMARDEVLKVMGQQIVEQPGVAERFLGEIRAVAKLRHPNIVSAYTAFRCGGSLVFAMEYVEGLDLRRMVKASGPMPVNNASYFVHQAALGLQHAHEEGMVHRDIKPGNLMLSRKKNRAVVKVLDFGLAKANSEECPRELTVGEPDMEGEMGKRLTLTGYILGTPDFVAPEQIVDSRKADIRADIYSLGCTLYYLLSARPPFTGATLSVLQAHQSVDPAPLGTIRPEVQAELAALVAKMMAKDPTLRFQEPAEVSEALAPFYKNRIAVPITASVGSSQAAESDGGAASVQTTQAELEARPPESAQAQPATTRPNLSPRPSIAVGELDPAAHATRAQPLRLSMRSFWVSAAALVGFIGVFFGAVAFNLSAHNKHGRSGTSLPPQNVTAMPDGARERVLSFEPNRVAEASNGDSPAPSGPIGNITVESPKKDLSAVAEAKSASVPAKVTSPDPRRKADPGQGKRPLPATAGPQIASKSKSGNARICRDHSQNGE